MFRYISLIVTLMLVLAISAGAQVNKEIDVTVLSDTADVIRSEMIDSATVVWNDSIPIARAEMIDSASTVVTFETLNTNGDVGTGADQVAQGSHAHSGTYLETAGTDNVKDTHIDWGAGAGQVDADDISDGSTNAIVTLTQESNWDTAFGWGDHPSLALYLTETGGANAVVDADVPDSITVTLADGQIASLKLSTALRDSVGNGVTAYGYGDHGAQNYFDIDTDNITDVPINSTWRLYYGNATVMSELGLGASGTYLKSTGAGAIPEWDTPAGGGSALSVKEETVEVDATVDAIDFGAGFDITESPEDQVNITLDLTEAPVDSTHITNGSISFADFHQQGAGTGQVIKWSGSAWAPATDNTTAGAGLIVEDDGTPEVAADTINFVVGFNVTNNGSAICSVSVDFSGLDTDGLSQGASNLYNQTHSGDVTGSVALTIANGSIDSVMFNDTEINEYVEDNAGAMVTGNTETLIAVTYNEDGTIDFVVDDNLANYSNASSGFITGNESITLSGDVSGTGTTGITTAIGADKVNDTHIDWGTGANQISADNIGDGSTYAIVTLTQESNWDTAHGWGDHSTQNYLDNDDAHVDTSGWNGAVDWGDHSTQNYLDNDDAHVDTLNWNLAVTWGDHSGQNYFDIDTDDVTDVPINTTWSVYYGNATVMAEVALGGDGTYLMSNGAAEIPTFETPAGGSALSVKEDDGVIDATVDAIDFGAGFDVSETPEDEVNITLDYTEFQVDSTGIVNGGIHFNDIQQGGASEGQIIKWVSGAWAIASDNTTAGAGLQAEVDDSNIGVVDTVNFADPLTATYSGDSQADVTIVANGINDTHIDWGSGAGQVDADDIGDGSTNAIVTLTQEGNWDDAYGWGDHSGQNYLDNDDANVDTTEWRTAYDHSQATGNQHSIDLDDIDNPSTSKTFTMGASELVFSYTTPSTNAFEINLSGAFSGDGLHVHQHTGAVGETNLALFEATDTDVMPLRVIHAGRDTAFVVTGGLAQLDSVDINGELRVDGTIDGATINTGTGDFEIRVADDDGATEGLASFDNTHFDVDANGNVTIASVAGVSGADEDNVTAAEVGGVSANLDNSDASVEWEDANDLDADGEVADDSHNHLITNIDSFTEAELETQLSDVTAVFTNNVTGDVTVSGGTSTLGADAVEEDHIADNGLDSEHYNDDSIDDAHVNWGTGGDQVSVVDVPATADRVFYSNNSGVVTELALGSDGEYLKSQGATSAPTWDTPAGGSGTDVAEDSTTVDVDATRLDFESGFDVRENPENEIHVSLDLTEIESGFYAWVDGLTPNANDLIMFDTSTDSLDIVTDTDTHILIADGTGYSNYALSGDVTMTNAGAVSVGTDKINDTHVDWGTSTNQVSIIDIPAVVDRIFYSNNSGVITELALGGSGEYLKSQGATSAPTWDTPAGSAVMETGTDSLYYIDSDGDTTFVVTDDDAGNVKWQVGTEDQTLKIVVDTVSLGGDVIKEFAGTGLTVTAGDLGVDDDGHNHVITNIDTFTETELETQLSDVTAVFTNNVTGDVTVSGGTSTLGTDKVNITHIDWGTGANQVSADDIGDGSTNAIITLTQETNFETAYTHSQNNSQEHTDYMINTGDVVTGVYDFGGATSIEIVEGSNPTINTAGQVAVDSDDNLFKFYGSAEFALGGVDVIYKPIWLPDSIQVTEDAIPLLEVETAWAPNGITITYVKISTDATNTDDWAFEEWETPTGGSVSAIETITASGVETSTAGIDNATIEAGNIIFLDLPASSGLNFVGVTICYKHIIN